MIHPGSSFLSVNQQALNKAFSFLLLICLMAIPAKAQNNPYASFFEEAYRLNPSIPSGVLEAIAYTNTRMNHLKPIGSCQELPEYFGVMGLVADGKGYFQNTLPRIAQLSGFSEEEIAQSPRINILAYAKAYATVQQNKRLTNKGVENHEPVLGELSEIPQDNSAHNKYALDQQFYSILTEMKSPHSGTQHRLRRSINLEDVFGKENYKVLSADWVRISDQRVSNADGVNFSVAGSRTADCTTSNNKPNYANAIWNPAHRNNFGSRSGTSIKFVTIHTVQGSYASAISWFRNPAARVSTHYVIRASDGQVTQMVCEKDRAFHVKTDNSSAIGIEHEGFIGDGGAWYTNEMYESSAALVRDICIRNGIDPLKTYAGPPTNGVKELSNTCFHVKGHQHFRGNNHIDPGPFWDWNRYYRLINPSPALETFTAKRGDVFDSGKSNGEYGNQERTTYLIKPEGASSVSLTFKAFDLEGTKEKPFDYLDIYDGESIEGRFIGRFTGNKLPGEILAKSGAVFMEFRSDCQKTRKGWHIQYTSRRKNPNCPNPTNLVASNIFPMGATLSWDKVDGADMYLVYLSRQLEDKWALYKTRSNSVTATGLSANGLYQWQIQVVCGGDTSALLGDKFITPSIGRKGAAQTYTVRLNQGRFYDSGGTFSGYANNENYLYRIIPSNGGRVVLKFSSFDTEVELDALSVYDGKSTNGRKIGTFSGKTLPRQITSTGNGLTLVFESDNRTNGKGWTASWKTVTGSGTVVDNGNTNNGNTNNNNTGNTGTLPDNSDFTPEIKYHVSTPETSPILKNGYKKSFALKFKDKDRSGRGLANLFYNIAQETPGGFRSNPNLGYFYEDFNNGFHSSWKSAAGNWQVVNGRLIQTNISVTNSNLWTALKQSSKDVFVYHWKAKMTGSKDNKRHGIHFFSSKPANTNRGDSYFVWIRDSDTKDYIEIYKTDNDKFDRKVRKEIRLEVNKVYDYKTIYNPSKGRIEVYLNDRFIVSWVDRFPLKQGNGISLRSGNCVVTYDDIQVYKKRGSTVNVSIGNKSSDDLKTNGRFKVNTLVVDRNIRWSKVGSGTSSAGVESDDNSSSNTNTNTGNTGGGDDGTSTVNNEIAIHKKDFEIPTPTPRGGKSFYLPSDLNGNLWRANVNLGFFADEFPESRPHKDWRMISGKWSMKNGVLAQTDALATNSNIFTPITQISNSVYLYHWKSRVVSSGDNRRFGLHFFASNGTQSNRGNSYFVWFRNYDSKDDKVEIYRVDNNEFSLRESKLISIKPGEWIDCKVLYDPSNGKIEIWLKNSKVLSWTDNKPPLSSGSAISFRTGNSKVDFDNLRVYQMSQGASAKITVGKSLGKMIRFKSQGKKPAARIHKLTLGANGRWSEDQVEARIE